MSFLILHLIGNSLFIFGLAVLFKPGMIFWDLVRRNYDWKDVYEDYVFEGPSWHKPIYQCTTCMSSLWGGLGYIHYCIHESIDLIQGFIHLPLYVLVLCGLNYLISKITS